MVEHENMYCRMIMMKVPSVKPDWAKFYSLLLSILCTAVFVLFIFTKTCKLKVPYRSLVPRSPVYTIPNRQEFSSANCIAGIILCDARYVHT